MSPNLNTTPIRTGTWTVRGHVLVGGWSQLLIASHLPSALAVPVQRPLEEDSLLGMTLRWPRVGMLLCVLPGTPVPLACHLRCEWVELVTDTK